MAQGSLQQRNNGAATPSSQSCNSATTPQGSLQQRNNGAATPSSQSCNSATTAQGLLQQRNNGSRFAATAQQQLKVRCNSATTAQGLLQQLNNGSRFAATAQQWSCNTELTELQQRNNGTATPSSHSRNNTGHDRTPLCCNQAAVTPPDSDSSNIHATTRLRSRVATTLPEILNTTGKEERKGDNTFKVERTLEIHHVRTPLKSAAVNQLTLSCFRCSGGGFRVCGTSHDGSGAAGASRADPRKHTMSSRRNSRQTGDGWRSTRRRDTTLHRAICIWVQRDLGL